VLWRKQAGGLFSLSADDAGERKREMAYKTLNVSCRGLNMILRVTDSQILLCTPPALYDKEKV
jgi:hypothetical protein